MPPANVVLNDRVSAPCRLPLQVRVALLAALTGSFAPLRAQGQSTIDLRAIGEELVALCEAVPVPLDGGWEYGDAWVPARLRELRGHVAVQPSTGSVSFASGESTFGYYVERRSAGRWRVVARTADGRQQRLELRTRPSRRLAFATIVSRARQEYARRIATDPGSLLTHQQRLAFTLAFADRTAVREATRHSVATLPDHWWPLLVNAIGDRGADAALRAWIRAHPTYLHAALLAEYDMLTGEVESACRGLESAGSLPVQQMPGNPMSASSHALGIAARCLERGRPREALHIAEAATRQEPETYARERYAVSFRAIQVAALVELGELARAQETVVTLGLDERDPIGGDPTSTVANLRAAVMAGDIAGVRAWIPQERAGFARLALRDLDVDALLGLRAEP